MIDKIVLISALFVGLYEVIVRLIPTVKDYTLLTLIFKILKVISENLQLKKK